MLTVVLVNFISMYTRPLKSSYNQRKIRILRAAVRMCGKSVGRRTTKIHVVCDTNARPIKLLITDGQVRDSQMVTQLIEGLIGVTYYKELAKFKECY